MFCGAKEAGGVYRPRHPQQTSFYQLVERFYAEFEAVYEERYQERYGFWRPSCHEKRALEKAGWVAEHVCAEVPHRQFVFTIPKRLRIYFRFDRRLLGDLCRAAARTVITVYRAASGRSHPAYSGRRGQARVGLFGFSDGQELSEHTSTQHALVQVLSGECAFSLEGTWHTMKPGSWLHMPPGVRHAVRATGAFSMVLTLVKPPQAVGVCG